MGLICTLRESLNAISRFDGNNKTIEIGMPILYACILFLVIVSIYIKVIKNRAQRELVEFANYVIGIFIFCFVILIVLSLSYSIVQVSYSHVYLLFIYFVFSQVLYTITNIITKQTQNKPMKLFILPILFSILPIFIIINQCTNYLCNFDQPFGNIFKHLKISEEMVDYVTIYLFIEIIFIVIYISILLANHKSTNIINFFCEETKKFDNKCVHNVHEQIFVYINFFRIITILAFIFVKFIVKIKSKEYFTSKNWLTRKDSENVVTKSSNDLDDNNRPENKIEVVTEMNNGENTIKNSKNALTKRAQKFTNKIATQANKLRSQIATRASTQANKLRSQIATRANKLRSQIATQANKLNRSPSEKPIQNN